MLSTPEFAAWSKKVVLFLHNTSHCDDEPYPDLLREKGFNGFPTVAYLDAEGRLLKMVGHFTPVAQLEESFVQLETWRDLKAAVAAGNRGKDKELFLLELEMDVVGAKEARARARAFDFDTEQKAAIQQQIVNLEFHEILKATPRGKQAESGKAFLSMFRGGRIPDSDQQTSFWQYMFAHATAEKDIPLYEELLKAVQEMRGDDPRLRGYLPRLERGLERLKRGG